MIVRKIALNGWRNYEFAAAEFSPGTNVITGENAQGKTNLLEAVYLLTGGGPGYATSILPTYIYSKSFKDFQMGMGSTVSVVAMLLMMVFVMLYLRVYNKSAEKVG